MIKLASSRCSLEENLLSNSHRASIVENQIKDLIIKLAELQQKFKSLLQRVSAVKVRALLGMEQGPVTWKVDVWEDPREAETFEPSDSQGFISSEEAVSSPSAPARKIFPFSPLTEEINPS